MITDILKQNYGFRTFVRLPQNGTSKLFYMNATMDELLEQLPARPLVRVVEDGWNKSAEKPTLALGDNPRGGLWMAYPTIEDAQREKDLLLKSIPQQYLDVGLDITEASYEIHKVTLGGNVMVINHQQGTGDDKLPAMFSVDEMKVLSEDPE